MLCQNCNKRPANIHLTKVVNDERVDLHLCEKCAQESAKIEFDYLFTFNNFLAGLLDLPSGYSVKNTQVNKKDSYKCENCGMSFDEFKRTGKFGCAQCYNVFNDSLEPILKRLHGNVHHSGKLPQRIGGAIKVKKEIERLRTQLESAIKDEEYEKAAQIRDKVRELEKDTTTGRRDV